MKVKFQGRGWYTVRCMVLQPTGNIIQTSDAVWVSDKAAFKALFPKWINRSVG